MLNHERTRQDIERMIHAEILCILEEREVSMPHIANDDKLHADLGIESLDLAQLVSVLEMKLQVDPFEEVVAITDVRSVGDLCQAYEQMLTGHTAPTAATDALRAAQERAQARRTRR